MKNFWGYAHNERFGVGCTGQSVYIYDAEGRELKRFSGLRYAYTPLLCPGKPLLAVKSAEPWLLFFDLERLEAVKKLRLRKPNQQTQDDGCCFSPDGERFFNLEAQNDMTGQLVIYDTRGFAEQARLFEGNGWFRSTSNRQKAETHTSFWAMSAPRLWRATTGKNTYSSRAWTQKAVWNAGRWTRNSIECWQRAKAGSAPGSRQKKRNGRFRIWAGKSPRPYRCRWSACSRRRDAEKRGIAVQFKDFSERHTAKFQNKPR